MAKLPDNIDTKVIGSAGLRVIDGRIAIEANMRLRGDRGRALYTEMADNQDIIAAILYIVTTHVRQVEWTTRPAIEGDTQAQEWADFVTSCLEDMSHTWPDFISEVLTMCKYGWAYFEKVYKQRLGPTPGEDKAPSKYNDGRWGLRKISIRPQESLDRWEFDANMGIQGMWQRVTDTTGMGNTEPVFIPIARALLFRTESTANNPEGRSMLRSAVKSYLYLKRFQEIEMIAADRDMTGLPHLTIPLDLYASTDPKDMRVVSTLKDTLNDVRPDRLQALMTPAEEDGDGPTGFRFKLQSAGGTRVINLDQVIRRYESRIAMGFLAEFVLLGSDKTGSYAMHDSKKDVFAVALTAMLQNIAAVIQNYMVNQLCAINGCPQALIPTLQPGSVASTPLADVAAFVRDMSSVGMLQYDRDIEAWLRAKVGAPPIAEDDMPLPAGGSTRDEAPDGEPIPLPGEDDDVNGIMPPPQPTPDDATGPAIAAANQDKTVAAVTLNGAQVSEARAIVTDVMAGNLPRESAEALLRIAFALTPEQAAEILAPTVGRTLPAPPDPGAAA